MNKFPEVPIMQKAYVLIKVEVGKAETVARAFLNLPGVCGVDIVMGPDDVIVILKKQNTEDIAKMVLTEISQIQGVQRTSTYLVVPLDTNK